MPTPSFLEDLPLHHTTTPFFKFSESPSPPSPSPLWGGSQNLLPPLKKGGVQNMIAQSVLSKRLQELRKSLVKELSQNNPIR